MARIANMKLRTTFSVFILFVAALASADHNWHLESYYNYSITGNIGPAQLHDIEMVMEGGSIDNSYGWGVSTGFRDVDQPGQFSLGLDTYPFFGTAAAQPFLGSSLILGIVDALPTDAPGQQHLALFTNPLAASRMQGVSFGTIFGTSNQPAQITEEQLIDAMITAHRDIDETLKVAAYDTINTFRFNVARQANVGVGGTTGDAWFTPESGFSIVLFSNGLTIGGGTNTTTANLVPIATPEPASIAALAVGSFALLRRRRR